VLALFADVARAPIAMLFDPVPELANWPIAMPRSLPAMESSPIAIAPTPSAFAPSVLDIPSSLPSEPMAIPPA